MAGPYPVICAAARTAQLEQPFSFLLFPQASVSGCRGSSFAPSGVPAGGVIEQCGNESGARC